MATSQALKSGRVKVIDLFCGVGGMTHGFVNEGFRVVAGIDNDLTCEYGYQANNRAKFIHEDIVNVTPQMIDDLFGECDLKVLIGCAPCQPYSQLNLQGKERDKKMQPLKQFAEIIDAVRPQIVSMENVKELSKLEKYPVFREFLSVLKKNKYHVSYKIVDCSRYGIPQKRKRLVLLASLLGPIELIPETHRPDRLVAVRDVIGHLEPLKDGDASKIDPLHRTSAMNALNKRRIRATPKNGGSVKDWKRDLVLDCHRKESGKSYSTTVYGRMRWDAPAPTMTTNCTGIGNGRFGHPEQNRAISLREAAIFQTFPRNYRFFRSSDDVKITVISKHIGNAVPVRLGRVIAKSIKKHILAS